MICHAGADQGWAVSTSNPPFHAENGGSTLSSCSLSVHFRCGGLSCSLRIGKSYTAIFEINPDKLTSCIEEAEQAIAQRESFVDITQAERHRLADARSVLKTLSRLSLP